MHSAFVCPALAPESVLLLIYRAGLVTHQALLDRPALANMQSLALTRLDRRLSARWNETPDEHIEAGRPSFDTCLKQLYFSFRQTA
jgi:hypothetical protein